MTSLRKSTVSILHLFVVSLAIGLGLLASSPATADDEITDFSGYRVGDVTVKGLNGMELADFLYLLELNPGSPLTAKRVRAGIRRVFSKGIFLDFLGCPASVFRGPAYFAWRTGVPLLPCAIAREPGGDHHIHFQPPVWPDPDWDEETAVRELSRRHVDALAAAIRRWPEQYFWVHRRWKTRPVEEDARDPG